MKDKLPPNNYDAECGVLGCILQDSANVLPEVASLGVESFYDLRNRHVFKIAMRLHMEGKQVDTSSIFLESKKEKYDFGGLDYIVKLDSSTPSPENLPYFLNEVQEKHLRRKIMQMCEKLSEQANNGATIDAILANAQKLGAIEKPGLAAIVNAVGASQRLSEDIQRRYDLNGTLSGLDTGFERLNYFTDGIQFGEQTLIGARPSFGKTAIGLNIFFRTAFVHHLPSLFVTIEMSIAALMRRLLAMDTNLTMRDIRRGNYSQDDFASFGRFHSLSRTMPIHFLDAVGGIGINDLCLQVRRHVKKYQTKLVVIDYLQKVKSSVHEEKKTYEIGEVSSRIKALAVETGAAFLTLAQLNRESEKGKKQPPRLSDLGDSKQIEQDADTVILIDRDRSGNNGEAKLIIAKQRDGEIGIVDVIFDGRHCRFENPPAEQ